MSNPPRASFYPSSGGSQPVPHPPDPCRNCQPVRLPDGRPSGCWRCGGVLLRRLSSRRGHLLRKPPAIAFHGGFWEQQRPALESVVVLDADTGHVWWITAAAFDRHAIAISRGCGPQVACPLPHWRAGTNGRAEGRQLALALGSEP